ncbi:hypothetical protein M5K25_022248 [Dendrobium thyrsiflorum]|uniref:Uncharacterized protein n=1 Tax=Dendrobium thyrsiflorum TaxID=117978 RepID=A0ABD0U5X7_DENTH
MGLHAWPVRATQALIIHQLRLYKAPRFGGGIGDEDDKVDERGKVFSQMGLAKSAMPLVVKS